jgi:hypothetical protein
LILDPGQLAATDQLAELGKEAVAEIMEAVRAGDAAYGESQNLAIFMSHLGAEYTPATLAALLVLAVRQIPPDV